MYHLIDKSIQSSLLLIKSGKIDKADAILNQTLKIQPFNARAWHLLSLLHYNDFDDALHRSVKAAVEGNGEDALILAEIAFRENSNFFAAVNLGLSYARVERYEDAHAAYLSAMNIYDDPYVRMNISQILIESMQIKAATELIEQSIDKFHGISGLHFNLSWCYFMQERYKEGWEHYAWRLYHFPELLNYLKMCGEDKVWDGTDLKDKRLLVYCEQGFGDTIQFCRYLKYIEGDKVIACDKALHRLLQPYGQVIDRADILKERFDCHVPLMSLPLVLKQYVPQKESAYLNIKWNQSDSNKIGICLQGSPSHPADKFRSVPSELVNLLPLENCISLQFTPIDGLDDNEINKCKDFYDTAKLMQRLDLVISADTAVLHLAGAMGVPTVGLLPFRPDFRWGRGADKWYDTVELIRQVKQNDWLDAIRSIDFSYI